MAMARSKSLHGLCAGALAATLLLAGCSRSDSGTTSELPAPAAVPQAAVTVNVCGSPVTYASAPLRAVTHDVNITEMFLFLGLGDRLVGYSGITQAKQIDPAFQAQLARVPRLAEREMNLEAILGASADFVFGGWSYGFRQGQITPEVLQRHGIASYVLSESCIRVGPRSQVALEDGLTDLRNLGRIFRIDAHAEQLAQGLERELKDLRERMQGVRQRPSVFVYDSGQDIPVTVGRYGMPQAMIEEAGGRNIFDDIPSNWPAGNWEDVVQRNPQWIVIIDYGQPHAQGKIDFLLAKPELAGVDAIREKRFFVMTYAEATPGPRNIARTRALAQALHPDRMPAPSHAAN
ncbi:ABC transporter substrate-binding protein [Delftia sp. DLF01]|uniref:ABC transporter substrate-binding protein n=1 Tax=Delftia sp. DLF01 TaxID=2769279 RepID=UPI00178241E6|nr:ABC transporter substrate-binding protein [Delftia sp. DLF01]MBD9581359.1 ABC transporter substrate-binding protein [Delftia sp. DLF01]